MRLDKRLADTGRWSRKESKALIKEGRVLVEGTSPSGPEHQVSEDTVITVDGHPIRQGGCLYLLLHKPAGVVSSTEDPRDPTVLSLLPKRYQGLALFPVGRLDKDTEGLLLLTNDGSLAHRLLAPGKHVDKTYYVEVDGRIEEADCQAIAAGLTLRDGTQCMPARLEPLPEGDRGLITLQEGKYHQVKRMLAARNKPVRYLKRLSMGPLRLDPTLPKGGCRELTPEERARLGVL